MRRRKIPVFTGQGEGNIVYIEGMNPDGSLNDNTPNEFNDLRIVIIFENSVPVFAGKWEGTTEPGKYWTQNPMNEKGAARIAFGHYSAWQLGMHHSHEAWVQTGGAVTVHRDLNEDFNRDNDELDTGYFGINQHWGYDFPKNDLGRSSAGCLVGRSTQGHKEFMAITKADPRFRADKRFTVSATILPAGEIV